MACRAGLVVEHREVHLEGDLPQRIQERNVGRRGVDRIGAQDDQQRHLSALHVIHERAQRRDVVSCVQRNRIGIVDRGPHAPERGIDGVRKGMHGRRLEIAGNDQ
jgi:hypothetical protein